MPRSHPKARKFSVQSQRTLTSNTDTSSILTCPAHAHHLWLEPYPCFSHPGWLQEVLCLIWRLSCASTHTQAFIWDPSVERNQMVLWTSITFCSLAVWSSSCRQSSWWGSDAQVFKIYILFVYNTACQINRCPRHPNDLSAEIFQSCISLPKLYFSALSLAGYFFTWCKKKKKLKL